MKSNFNRRKANEKKDNNVNRKIYLDNLSSAERNRIYSNITKDAYMKLLKENGEEKIIYIFEYMLSQDYILKITGEQNKNDKRLIKEVKTAVNYTVKNIILNYVEEKIEDAVEEGIKHGKTKKEIISTIQNSKDFMKLLEAEDKSNEFFRTLIEQIKKSIDKQVDILEEEEEKDKRVSPESKQEEKNRLQKDKKRLQEDKEFMQAVSKYTDDYKFLAESRPVYISQNGNMYPNVEKRRFKNVDQYFRFVALQEKLQNNMTDKDGDEVKAINRLLNKKVDDIERKILENRKNKILIKRKYNQEGPEI